MRGKSLAKFNIAQETDVSYKNITLLQKFVNTRGKMIPRRVSGVPAKVQRRLAVAIKRARFLALLTTGGVKK
jgi:small subunit ribosomal protein S18